jgi:hypothetical protein
VSHAALIAATETIAVRFPIAARNIRIAILVAVVHVWPAVVVGVSLRANDPVAKSAALDLLQFLRRRIPAAAILAIAGRWRSLRHSGSFGRAQTSGSQKESKCRYCKSIESHSSFIPLVEKIPQHSVLSKEKDTGGETARMPNFAQDRSFGR